jgi:hypothetical protein
MKQFSKFFVVVVLGFLLGIQAKAEYQTLSENTKVMLFTCGPGLELYAGFGHSALWISDPENKVDRLYNYGTFDFETPNFYTKFVKGRLDYMLSVTTFERFLREYERRGISVYGQMLDLSSLEKQRLYEFIENNAKPENRNYRYDFFYDNCATRFRDVLNKIADGEVNYNIPSQNTSLRKLLFPYLGHTPWVSTGINIILGLPSDKKAATEEYMFLPYFLQVGFENATITKEGVSRKLVTSGRELLPNRLEFKRSGVFTPTVVFGLLLLLAIVLTWIERKKRIYFRWFDVLIMSMSALAGLFLFLMWVATDHTALNYNLNSIWLLPAQLFFLFVISKRYKKKYIGSLIALVYMLVYFLVQWVLPQEKEISFLLMQILFAVRFSAGRFRWK